MKNLFIMCSALLLVSCTKAWKTEGLAEKIMLPDVQVVAGGHCESSAMLNALRYQGYDVNESMIAGGGAALSFMFEKSEFPFLNARNGDMREVFFSGAGIKWHKTIPSGSADMWPEIYRLLASGIPVVLRVDMRYLPYKYDGKYGPANQSFGWHMITLFGVDPKNGTAVVSDTECNGLQTIRLADLHKARTSATKVYPPKGEYYWAEPKPAGYATDWDALVSSSLENVIRNYEWKDESGSGNVIAGISGMKEYGATLASIESFSTKRYLLPYVFAFMAGNIEDFGTGGAAFRILYRDFLIQAAEKSRYKNLARVVPLLNDSIAAWHALAGEFRKTAAAVNKLTDGEKTEQYAQLQKTADDLYNKENRFFTELKLVYYEGNDADNR